MQSTTFLFIIILFVVLIYLKKKLPLIKGIIGEKKVGVLLSFLPKSKYVVLNDLMFKSGSYTTQIDHIVISVYGIFVIETKSYKGWIIGSSYKDYWTQNIYGNKYSLYNPIFQNKKHISFLLRKFDILRSKRMAIFPVVVFLRSSKLKLAGNCDCVVRFRKLISYIRSFSQCILTIEECNYVVHLLQTNNISSKSEKKRHIKNVTTAKLIHNYKINHRICPLCGGRLVLRNSRYGEFYGCSNFPHCKYTR